MSAFECAGSLHWGESQVTKTGSRDRAQPARFLISADGYASLDSQPEARSQMPYMDHWNVPRPHVSLRDIIKEEQALQKNMEKVTYAPSVPAEFSILSHTNTLNNIILVCSPHPRTPVQPSFFQTRQSRADLDRRDGATLLKENQLYALFPTIDRHFLQDIFRDHK